MEGNIYRWTNAIFGWQKKFGEIEGDEFRYYKKKGAKLQGAVSLRNSRVEMIANEPLRLIVQLAEGTIMYLKCNSMSEKVKWVNAFCLAQQTVPDSVPTLDSDSELKKSIASLLRSRLLNDSSKLNAYVTQAWTLQGLLEGTLSDFSEDIGRLVQPPESLQNNAESLRRYTSEMKVRFLA